MAVTPNLGLTKPAKGDTGWWVNWNGNADLVDALFADAQKSLALPGTSPRRLLLHRTAAGAAEITMRPVTGSGAGEADWRIVWEDGNSSSGLGANNYMLWRGGVQMMRLTALGDCVFYGTRGAANVIVAQITPEFNANETALILLTYDGANVTPKRVYQGPPDSGGAGFRILRVAN